MENETSRFKTMAIFAALALMLASCTNLPKNNGKVDWSEAKGDENAEGSYPRAKLANLNLPVVSSKETILIKGTCFYFKAGDDFGYPLKFVTIEILKGGKVISQTSTDDRGRYSFHLNIPRGEYTLQVDSGNYVGKTNLSVQSLKNEDIILRTYLSH